MIFIVIFNVIFNPLPKYWVKELIDNFPNAVQDVHTLYRSTTISVNPLGIILTRDDRAFGSAIIQSTYICIKQTLCRKSQHFVSSLKKYSTVAIDAPTRYF